MKYIKIITNKVKLVRNIKKESQVCELTKTK